jgi:N-acetylglucosaminyldiphosphoundecaprenol N-acetyl-beta-D-mannosaminyltransferase
MNPPPAYSFLGVTVNALTVDGLGGLVESTVGENAKYVIGYHNLHSLYIYHHDPVFRKFYERANYVHVDGMPLVWAGKLLGYPLKRRNRLTSVDWLPPLLKRCAAKDLRIFFLGSKPGIAEKAVEHFVADIPTLRAETHHGYFDTSTGSIENEQVLRTINCYRPHVLFVGMGMPRQERWILENVERLDVNVVWSMGAFMDYFAGTTPTPPRWMGRWGLEWLYRLLSEPKRMWKRYLLESPFALWLLAGELARHGRRVLSK